MSNEVKAYLEEHYDEHLEELKTFLAIPSVSALSDHKADMKKTADWLTGSLTAAGLENVEIMETKQHPVVYADWLHAENKPTVLIYGHYDVQPVDPIELWETPPFEPTIRDDKMFARGASDDKGQVFMHIKMIEAILKTENELPVNVKFIIEGEEEIGSPSLDPFVEEHENKLAADVLLVSDTTMVSNGHPAVCYGLRGLCGLQIDLKGAKGDLHSGLYGGAIQNPLHAITELLASMHDKEGVVTIDGFYDAVKPLTDEEMSSYEALSADDAMKKELNVPALYGEKGYSTIARIWGRPTLEVNGLFGGFQGEGIKTVIPSEAHAKISCRLVPDQDPADIAEAIKKHIKNHLPEGVTVETTLFDQARPFITPYDHPAIEAAGEALEKAYGVKPTFSRMGGSVPIVETFNTKLGLPAVLMGFGLNEENFHAPNEHFHLENFRKGLVALVDFLYGLDDKLNA